MHLRYFLALLALLFVFGCARQEVPVAPDPQELVIEEDAQELDKELTEAWPDVPADIVLDDAERAALETKLSVDYILSDYSANEIQKQFIFLKRTAPRTVKKWIMRSHMYLPYIKQHMKEQGLPEEISYLPFMESGFNVLAYSRAGAAGLWQFMPATGRKYGLTVRRGIDERRNPLKSTRAAAQYLKTLYNMFGDWGLAMASYNAGEGKIMKAIKRLGVKDFFELHKQNHKLPYKYQLRKETLDFVPRFLAVCKLVKNLDILGFPTLDDTIAADLGEVYARPGTDLTKFAKALEMTWEEFRRFNLAFRSAITPPGGKSPLIVPKDKLAAAEKFLSKPLSTQYDDHDMYTVRKGDTWSRISKRYGVPVWLLKTVNGKKSNLIRPGQRVIVPLTARAKRTKSTTTASRSAIKGATYKVRRGDTVSEIAARTGVSSKALMKANGLRSAKSLRAGQTLKIPGRKAANSAKKSAKKTNTKALAKKRSNYTVRKGETLSAISKRTGVSVNTLLKANGMRSAKSLRAGQKLYIPDKTAKDAAKTRKKAAKTKKRIQYKVQKGDTIWRVARRFQVSEKDLLVWNKLNKKAVIRPGQMLTIYPQ